MRCLVSLSAVIFSFLIATAIGGEPPSAVPKVGELNSVVLQVAESYPKDGTHKYFWPKGSGWAGTTRDLFYLGKKVADGDPEKRAYCCGLTFEVLFRAWEVWAAKKKKIDFRIGGLTP